jgi:hypothetical protein
MEFQLKSISADGIPEALAKVERYRLLNEPTLAESICLDILSIEPDNQQALVALLLARTDQFDLSMNSRGAQDVLEQIKGEYEHAYYRGIVLERLGHARIRQGMPGSSGAAYYALREAMAEYEKAAPFSQPGNDDAILRWNTCARTIMQNPEIEPSSDNTYVDAWLSDEANSRIADA